MNDYDKLPIPDISNTGSNPSPRTKKANENNALQMSTDLSGQILPKKSRPGPTFNRIYHVAPKACEQCQGIFMARVGVKFSKRRFCSFACFTAHAKATQRYAGENNPRWLGGVSRDPVRYTRQFKAKYPEKAYAHQQVMRAKKTGKLVPQPCEVCQLPHTHAHHDDYSKPLEVRWLCQACHNAKHAQERRAS